MAKISIAYEFNSTGECTPISVVEDRLVVVANRWGSNNGKIVIFKVSDKESASPPVSKIGEFGAASGLACFQGLTYHYDRLVIIDGLVDSPLRKYTSAMLGVVDPLLQAVKYLIFPNTGLCNWLIGIAASIRHDLIIVGERCTGGNTAGSAYPHGAGLWIARLSDVVKERPTMSGTYFTLFTAARRIGELGNGAEWRSIAVCGDYVLAAIWLSGSYAGLIKCSIDDLIKYAESDRCTPTNDLLNVFELVDTGDKTCSPYVHAGYRYLVGVYKKDINIWLVKIDPSSGEVVDKVQVANYVEPVFRLGVNVIFNKAIVHVHTNSGNDLYLVDLDRDIVYGLGNIPYGEIDHADYVVDRFGRIYFPVLYTGSSNSRLMCIYPDKYIMMSYRIINAGIVNGFITVEVECKNPDGSPAPNVEVCICLPCSENRDEYTASPLCSCSRTDNNGRAIVRLHVPESLVTALGKVYGTNLLLFSLYGDVV